MKDNEGAKHDPSEHKAIAIYVAAAFGGGFHVREYYHDTERIAVDILRCEDSPHDGVTSYSTIGLLDHRIPWGEGEFPVRLELAGVCATTAKAFPNVLASAAFYMMRTDDVFHPGAVLENYVRLYFPDSPLPHLYLTAPFTWDNLKTFDLGSKMVTWLQAMPISQSERQYLKVHGDAALERLFGKIRINASNIYRAPVV